MQKPSDNLVETIYAELRLRLQRSDVSPSDRLVDTEIAGRYGVSRVPAREALLRLVAEGYLVGTTRGFALRQLSLEDIADLFEMRRQLEPRAAANAARDMTPDIEAELTDAMTRIEAALADGDLRVLMDANVDFRNAWLNAVRNRHMADTVARFMNYFQSVRLDSFTDKDMLKQYIDGLSRIHAAFVARDPVRIAEYMTLYMFAAEQAFLAVRQRQLTESETARPSRRKKDKQGR
ncbi:GntR family transcriptional regulator [Rhizobium oryzicola]|uniref:GntR family transcriptional regulator n=1 Tax=Rhizobium oryzicola TaxID=1232668 RepID=A0ABT8SWB1_9HYPH|nr:GntR family transcriptional regulator [Rhizobium oryzicola]MDO1582735.1 GntR family transcriptional regulator [Rhizobium oryzicola]